MKGRTQSSAPSFERKTYVYGVVDGCEIKVDVLGATLGAKKPCVIWIHGGGLIFGSRTKSPREPFLRALLAKGFVVLSIDHRLAPETKLPSIVEDVQSAWHWILARGSTLGIDSKRMAVAGASSGAYLSLISGYSLSPKPRAIASFWGFGDITAPWEARTILPRFWCMAIEIPTCRTRSQRTSRSVSDSWG